MCKDYLPHKLKPLQDEYERNVLSRGQNYARAILGQAQQWEEAREHSRAVDCLVQISPQMTDDKDLLQKGWSRAGEMAVKFLDPHKAEEVASLLGKLVNNIGSVIQIPKFRSFKIDYRHFSASLRLVSIGGYSATLSCSWRET